jgi:hypothetical protein
MDSTRHYLVILDIVPKPQFLHYSDRLLAVHIMSNTALTGATYDIDGGQQLVS